MKIYVSHAKNFDYENELYEPLKASHLPIEFIFPHKKGNESFDPKKLFQNKGCDLVLADVSIPSTEQGIEMGWANVYGVPIICIYKSGSQPSSAVELVAQKIIEYSDIHNLVNTLTIELGLNIA